MGSKFVNIPAESLLGVLNGIGEKVTKAGGSSSHGTAGREVTVDLTPPKTAVRVRVYTSLGAGEDTVRDCGEDAVRIVVGYEDASRFRPLAKSRRIYRTAPQGPTEERIAAFLARLTQALREAYATAAKHPVCYDCGRPMQLRTNKAKGNQFWGCVGFPECRKTFNYTPPPQ